MGRKRERVSLIVDFLMLFSFNFQNNENLLFRKTRQSLHWGLKYFEFLIKRDLKRRKIYYSKMSRISMLYNRIGRKKFQNYSNFSKIDRKL